ncbi:MAG: hypothetical protein M0R22_04785 [Dehalococcoidia bacterium]|jgi:hypothetical protein|nr:hypothetical protein [Dehalococcoidia bacterium]
MKNETRAAIVAAVLTIGIVFVFTSVLHKSQDVVPLFLVPVFLYAGYAVATAGLRIWLGLTLAVTLGLTILYAMP